MSLSIPRGDHKPIVWSIAGSDSGAGAGLQTDLKTLTVFGVHACTIVTSVTAQSTAAVAGYESVSAEMLAAQIDAMREDLPPRAIKIGMLGDAESVRVLSAKLASISAFVIYDPVMIATSGARLLNDETMAAMREQLLPRVDLLTPNIAEAEVLSGIKIHNDKDVVAAANAIQKLAPKAVLIKGWNEGKGFVQDYIHNGDQSFWLTLPLHEGEVPRGTGCTLASALAAAHAFGYDMSDAAVIAKAYVHRGFRQNYKIGKGPSIIDHQSWPVSSKDFPWLTSMAEEGRNTYNFPSCGGEPLGFYPVVDSVAWLKRILPLGVRTAQLRVKNLVGAELENEIAEAAALGHKHGTRLFINDYWQLAIKHKAYGVHLGQQDLETADMAAIAKAGLRLGLSTHSYAEAARAKSFNPSYVALGPIFPTTLKSMKFVPQGIETLKIWRQLFECPLVAIGGIKLNQADDIYAAGADSIAVVSEITQSDDPEVRVKTWLELTKMRKGPVHEWDGLTAFA